jgi:hypothetical protein
MYQTQVARVKLLNLISKSKFINTNQMSIHLFPVMHLYALHIFDLLEHPSDLIVNVSFKKDQACTCTTKWVAISDISCD